MHVLRGRDVPLERHVLKSTGECGRGVNRIGDGIESQRGMEPGESLVRKGKTGVIVVDRRIEQNLGMRSEMRKRRVMVELIVEHLHHDVGASEIGKPVPKNILREKPSPDPTALKVKAHRLA